MARLPRVALIVVACALVYDAARPPARQVSARAAIAGIHVYQRTLSPALAGGGAMCRFTPTCSRYAETVIARDGIVRGGWSAVKRLARCGPWTPVGTKDEP
ncbi:MAG TPA: membrane protein insertion efficiency factor YidD [Vicinamibacterales bacterium]|nr:membrane protein insertion efficiency factor YidD [Vicinamibacterales bacterium]